MATELRRFTISITPAMDELLDAAKQQTYYRGTQNDMIRDLIERGLKALEADENEKEKRQKQSA